MFVPTTCSKGLSHSELFWLSRGLAMLDNRFHPQLISHKHTLHLCRARPAMCRSDLIAPDRLRTTGIFGNPESCCPQFSSTLHKMVCWLHALQSRRTISNQENLPCLHDMESPATNSSRRSTVSLVSLKLVVPLAQLSALDRFQLLLSATADQVDQYPQVPVHPD